MAERERYRLVIPGTLPGLNEYINAERSDKHKAAALKRSTEQLIAYMAASQLRDASFTLPVTMSYRWVEPNRRRDKDNIAFAKKFVQDALVSCGYLPDDGWRQIEHFTDDFAVDAKNPRVEVTICSATDGAGQQNAGRKRKKPASMPND